MKFEFKYSLRTAFVVITLLGTGLGWYHYRATKWNELEGWQSSLRPGRREQIHHEDKILFWSLDSEHPRRWLWAAFALPLVTNVVYVNDQPEDVPLGIRKALRHAPHVELGGHGVDDSMLQDLSPSLDSIQLRGTNVSSHGIGHLTKYSKLWSLDARSLLHVNTRSHDLAIPILQSLSAWPNLAAVKLDICLGELVNLKLSEQSTARGVHLHLRPDQYSSCAELPGDDPLGWLSVFGKTAGITVEGNGPIDDELLRQIARHCPHLDIVRLGGGRLTVAGMEQLATLKRLEVLRLEGCEFAADELVKLRECAHLRFLSLRNVEVQYVEELQQQFGIPKIEYTVPGDRYIRIMSRESD